MTWRERTAVAILLLVARIILPTQTDEIKTLATNIAVWGKQAEPLVEADAPRENGAAT